jgi:hypothetical protein
MKPVGMGQLKNAMFGPSARFYYLVRRKGRRPRQGIESELLIELQEMLDWLEAHLISVGPEPKERKPAVPDSSFHLAISYWFLSNRDKIR